MWTAYHQFDNIPNLRCSEIVVKTSDICTNVRANSNIGTKSDIGVTSDIVVKNYDIGSYIVEKNSNIWYPI